MQTARFPDLESGGVRTMSERLPRTTMVLLAGLLSATPVVAIQEPVDVDAVSARFQTVLDSLYDAAQGTDETFPGATAAFVLPDGRVFGFATGFSDVERGVRMAPDMRMPSGSIGKTYVAATALSMVLDGTLDLDAPISTWLGDEPWFGRVPNGPDLTLRHLLTHSGGLIDHAFDSEAFVARVRELIATDPDATLSHLELLEFALDREPLFPAGMGYNYTDTGYILAGLVMEAASGRPYYTELRERILEPLGLAMTHPQDRRDAPRLAQGYAVASAEIFGTPEKVVAGGRMVFNPAIEWTGGGLYNNPQSLVRWAKLLYEGEALEGDYLGDLLESAVRGAAPRPGSAYSLGVSIQQTPLGITYGHSGFFPGYNSIVMYFPDRGVAIALQINADQTRGGDHATTLARALFGALGGGGR